VATVDCLLVRGRTALSPCMDNLVSRVDILGDSLDRSSYANRGYNCFRGFHG